MAIAPPRLWHRRAARALALLGVVAWALLVPSRAAAQAGVDAERALRSYAARTRRFGVLSLVKTHDTA